MRSAVSDSAAAPASQVEAQLSAVRTLLTNDSPGGVDVASVAHQAAIDLLSSVPRDRHADLSSPEACGASSPPQQQQHHAAQATHPRAARRSLDYLLHQQQQQQRSQYGGCRVPSPLGLPQIPGSPGPASARHAGEQTPRQSAQQAAANLGQLAAMKAELAKAMAALV